MKRSCQEHKLCYEIDKKFQVAYMADELYGN